MGVKSKRRQRVRRRKSRSSRVPSGFRVTGIGGVFLRTRNQRSLLLWYRRHLGIRSSEFGGFTFRADTSSTSSRGGSTTWSLFPKDTDYFGDRKQSAMINYRVDDLDAAIAHLRRSRVRLDPHQESYEYGKFAWAYDSEGNRFELWEPREPPTKKGSKGAS
jgi:predicted enzyme related to lactoylglutathione lyase